MALDTKTAQLIGEIHANVEHISKTQDEMKGDIKEKFDGLNCESNQSQISLLWEDYQERKAVKFAFLKQSIGYIISGLIAAFTTAFAVKG